MSSIAELFATDPLKLTRDDRAKIIAEMRASRERFLNGVKTPKASAPKPDLGALEL